MAIGTESDFIIYSAQFWSGVVEVLQQNTEAFNAASNNALRLVTRNILGDYEKESFLKSTAGLISYRNVTLQGTISDNKIVQGEQVGVKISRRIGPVAQDRNSFRKAGLDPQDFSYMLGAQTGPSIAVDYVNVAVAAVRAAISGQSSLQYDATQDTLTTLNHTAMAGGMSKFGDRSGRLVCWAMHSKNYFDLMKQQIADKLFEVAGATVYAGTMATFGKPVVVVDSPSFATTSASVATVYDVLLLTENAAEIAESEDRDIISQPITGLENLADRIQGEYAFNLKVKGVTYNVANGANPTNASIASSANWTSIVADLKEYPGVRISCH